MAESPNERLNENLRALADHLVNNFQILDRELRTAIAGVNARLDRLTGEIEQLRAAVLIGDDEPAAERVPEGDEGH